MPNGIIFLAKKINNFYFLPCVSFGFLCVICESKTQHSPISSPGAHFPKAFQVRKVICKTAAHLFCKAGLFICFRGSKNSNNFKVSCLETPSLLRWRIVTRNAPKKFRDFREMGPRAVNPQIFQYREFSDVI